MVTLATVSNSKNRLGYISQIEITKVGLFFHITNTRYWCGEHMFGTELWKYVRHIRICVRHMTHVEK